MEDFRKGYEVKGVSVNATKHISDTRREGSATNYKFSWGRWASWCRRAKIDPFHVMSVCHKHIDGRLVGKHPIICALLSGVWNVEIVLQFTLHKNEEIRNGNFIFRAVLSETID